MRWVLERMQTTSGGTIPDMCMDRGLNRISQTKVDLCQSLGDSHRTKACFQQTERRDLTTQRMRGA
ncbi:hypothetical protein K466DRAFT_591965 [Polyporus arcularius HHB13444]|uniref:Uncharacterized protein n=1 Tax=Polyporus arcularius HHB13444 TaxID=1314778 RepID=A0A5C3NTD4_9APHY|nr:hypothetical protein K466DRAFT_591965 [Polyporus arcularius HHB13444]